MDPQTNRFFITGTDTGVGKTVLSLLMMQFFYDAGYSPFYLKPFQTGCHNPYDKNSDARFIYEHVGPLNDRDPADSVLYCFPHPKAPYFAARDDGRENDIDLSVIREHVDKKARSFNPVILEGAGGLFVPVGKNTLIIDLIKITTSRPIVVARAGLGTINHTLLALEALEKRCMVPAGVVFIDSGKTPTPGDMIHENIEAVEKVSGIKVAGMIDRITDFSHPGKACYRPLEKMLADFSQACPKR